MSGILQVVGMGPGDPDLLTLKAVRLIEAAPVVAFFAKRGRTGHARSIAGDRVAPDAELLRFEYPFTTELAVDDPRYLAEIGQFYETCAAQLAERLAGGQDVALLCEGDPFFYGSAMYLFDRLHREFRTEIVPGITGMSGCWSAAGIPFTHGDDVLMVLPGTLDRRALASRLATADAAVIMKVGSNLAKIQAALEDAGLLSCAVYVESGMMPGQRIMPLAEMAGQAAPYFSMVLVPGRRRTR